MQDKIYNVIDLESKRKTPLEIKKQKIIEN